MVKNFVIGLVIIAVVVGGLVYFNKRNAPSNNQSNQQESSNQTTVNFKQTGNLVKNNPRLKADTWYLVYEQPGAAALNKELKFTQAVTLQKGMRAYVEGNDQNGVVTVSAINILNAYKDDLIWVQSPLVEDVVQSPLSVSGYARGSWYFEAVFPIKLYDAANKLIASGQGRAQSSWTTSDYVPFTSALTFASPATDTGTLVLQKDNPSGLPANADELRVPVKFEVQKQNVKLYYYDPNKDKDASGNIQCSRQGLVAVQRQIPLTNTPIQDTIKLLLQGPTASEKSSGATSEYPLPGLSLKGANLVNKVLTLEFSDPQNKTVGGSCRVGVLWFQIEATAKQFSSVTSVKFKPDTLFQP